MQTKIILFDLDGTLLPMQDQEVFTKTYFGLLAKRLAPFGYDPKAIIEVVWSGTKAMIMNDGKQNNEQVFWNKFAEIFGEEKRKDIDKFEEFYIEDFDKVKISCGKNPLSAETISKVKELGFKVVLATNPIFPAIATEKRIKWAGLNREDFELVTTYENSNFCKPNLKYYQEILNKLNVLPEECLMVGNDATEDMVAQKLGMKVFLLTDNLINKNNEDISLYPNGSFPDLFEFINNLNKKA